MLAAQSSDEASTFCSHRCFHQALWLPATAHHTRLRVTFATTRNFEASNASELPTVLLCLPMGASRLLVYDLDHIAQEAGVKLLLIDR